MIIDLSKYQNQITWAKILTNKTITGVYIKATEGVGYIDQKFKDHIIGANSINMPIGFYHFATLNSKNILADSAAEAKAFYTATKGFKASLPYVLDIEREDIALTKEEFFQWITNFFLTLHLLGINDVALYSGKYFLDENLPDNHNLGNVRLWLAAYTASPPKLPKGWANYWLWQYTGSGIVDGISGKVDLNKYPG